MVEENASDNDQDKEFQGVADDEKKYRTTKMAVDKVLYPSCIPASNASPPASDHSCATGVRGRKHLVKLPKIQLHKFNGDLMEWLGFWAQFEKIHEDNDIAVPDKFQCLVQTMVPGSRAQEVLCSYPQSVDNYAKAIDALKQRFGKEELLVEVYVRELLKLVINNITQGEKPCVSKMFDKLEM